MSGHDMVGLLLSAPSPSDGQELNSVTVSPGLPGFFATFLLAAGVVLLAVDMTRRVRRVQAKARVEQRHADVERSRESGGAGPDEQSSADAEPQRDSEELPRDSQEQPRDSQEQPRDSGSPNEDDPPQR